MADEHELEQALTGAIQGMMRYAVIVDGVITAVDADPTNPASTWTCSVQVGGPQGSTYFNVIIEVQKGIQASIMGVPVLNSECLLIFRDGNIGRPQLYKVDQVQDWLIDTNGNTIFNKGTNGGMVKLLPAVDRWNLIEQDINTLKNILSAWVPDPGDGGAALKAAAGPWFADPLVETQRTDVENTKIQQ